MTENTKDWKKYEKKYNCTRNQYRRIVNGAPYQLELDGPYEEYTARKELIGKE
jgi:hypothetical protein